uniref:Cation channel sperm associated auxiliary subunit beta n=1 Tax=Ornithorhynchus anatinus TaxID=9258 RepID=A0A6I8NMW0_ORNAN
MLNKKSMCGRVNICKEKLGFVVFFSLKVTTTFSVLNEKNLLCPNSLFCFLIDIAATEEWFVTIALHDGLNIFSTEGTLLDIFREPILQWQLGEIMDPSEVKDIIPHLTALTLTQSPCASDVGIIGLICENNFPVCIDFVLVDIILTNHHFVILSSWGLFISEDLRYPKGQILQVYICILLELLVFVSVNKGIGTTHSKKRYFPIFTFPDASFEPVGMFFHPRSHFLYVYGNQVWLSVDGGNTFDLLVRLPGELIVKIHDCVYTQEIIFVTKAGILYITKAGEVFIWCSEALFLFLFSPSGSLVIEKVFQHDYPPGYASSVFATIVEKIPVNTLKESPCLNNSKLKSNFKVSDIEKTVVIPGYSSFLIFEIINNNSALAYATMPERIPLQTMPKDFWFIYDFGIKAGRKWKISQDPCNYWFQHKNNQSLNVIKYVDLGKTKNFTFRTIPIRQAISEFQMPLLDVIVGNPTLLEVKTKQYWDDIDSYTMEIYVKSKFLQKGSTSIAIVIWKASIECPVTTVILTLKSSCSYGKRMIFASHEKMMHPNSTMGHESEYDTKMKKLPVNYRPPSNLGIAIPLTDNIYNADPSKGRPRDYFPKSRLTGKYKQCANKTSRAECNCTENQKLSDNVAFSDCKEEVPRQKFPVVKYPIILGIVSEDGWIPLEPPYLITMTEVNNRETWKLKDNESLGVEKMKKYLKEENKLTVYNPKGLNLSIMGSELFHFRVTTVPGVTFCPLVVEFQIYVDEVPIAFPGRSLIATTTAIFLGGFIFVTFLIKMYNIHAWDSFKTMLMKKVKISVSSSSLSGQSF